MLGWAVNLTGFLIICTVALVGYSLGDMLMYGQPINIRDVGVNGFERGVRYSIAFEVNNTSPLPIQDMSYTVNITSLETVVAGGVAYIPRLPGGCVGEAVLVLDLDLVDLPEEGEGLLLRDRDLEGEMKIGFRYGGLVTFKVKPPSMPVHFGAPLHNLSAGKLEVGPYNTSHHSVGLPLSFENHSPLQFSGVTIRILNEDGQAITLGRREIDVPPESGFHETLKWFMDSQDITELGDEGSVEFVFETPDFRFKGVEIPYG